MTAHPGGDRWLWESRIFARAPTRCPRDKVEQTVTAWVAVRRHDVVYRGKAVKGSWWRALATRIEAHTDEGSWWRAEAPARRHPACVHARPCRNVRNRLARTRPS
ncbi:hypothetical protein [Streptosporangium minutum]|uniref:hypothetical protein n=1 Tax=Streptosporangium minutum TaxID=569862 RepID=UPI001F607239|nr:hypothetical protein [Streptosporangium minutum]